MSLLGLSDYSLRQLISLDGFDIGAGEVTEDAWLDGVSKIRSELAPRPGNSLFEIGCGSGAFMRALGDDLKYTGIDLSTELVEIAQKAVPGGDFYVWDLNRTGGKLPKWEPTQTFDFCLIHGVLHYLDIETALETVRESLRLTSRKVFIGEIPNSSTRTESEEFRRESLPDGDYSAKYSLLEHTYFAEEVFQSIATDPEFRPYWKLNRYPLSLIETPQQKFRFAVLFTKRM